MIAAIAPAFAPAAHMWCPSSSESFNEFPGDYPYQAEVDFGLLGQHFHVIVAAGTGDGGGLGICLVRIGGTYDTIDGTVVLEQAAVASPFFRWSVHSLVRNVWSGLQPVKVTGRGGLFGVGMTLLLYPA